MSTTWNIPADLDVAFAPILGKLDGLRIGVRIGGSPAVTETIIKEVIAEINAVLAAKRAAADPEAKAAPCRACGGAGRIRPNNTDPRPCSECAP